MFSRKIIEFHTINLDRKFNKLSDSVVKLAKTEIWLSANQKAERTILKKYPECFPVEKNTTHFFNNLSFFVR